MKDRIRLIMESQHMAQNSFAQFIGLSPATLSSIFNGRTNPTLSTVEAIHSKLPLLNIDWLMFGTGQMYRSTTPRDTDQKKNDDQTQSEPQLLFDAEPSNSVSSSLPQMSQSSHRIKQQNSEEKIAINFDKNKKTITEIRVFFDDQTYESFVPKK